METNCQSANWLEPIRSFTGLRQAGQWMIKALAGGELGPDWQWEYERQLGSDVSALSEATDCRHGEIIVDQMKAPSCSRFLRTPMMPKTNVIDCGCKE
jgi:hypothetical protein